MLTSYKSLIQSEVPSGELIISRTDLHGNITYANETFAFICGYSVDELIGKPHSIVRHPDMPKSVFKELWTSIKAGKIWKGYVKNLRKDGGYYWVYAEVSGVYKDGKLVEYKSLRSPIDQEVQEIFQEKYDALLAKEEGKVRAIVTLNIENIEKLTKLAHDKKITVDEALKEILDDTLL